MDMRSPRTLDELYAFWAAIRAEHDALDARYAADRAAAAAVVAEEAALVVAQQDAQARTRRERLRAQQGPRITPQTRRWTRGR